MRYFSQDVKPEYVNLVYLKNRCLTNIASSYSRHTRTIVGAAPQLISFLSAPNPALQEQALWALGNIAGDSDDFRRMLRANGALLPMFRLLQNPPVRVLFAYLSLAPPACVNFVNKDGPFRWRVKTGQAATFGSRFAKRRSSADFMLNLRTFFIQSLPSAQTRGSLQLLSAVPSTTSHPAPPLDRTADRDCTNSGVGDIQPRARRRDSRRALRAGGANICGVPQGRRPLLCRSSGGGSSGGGGGGGGNGSWCTAVSASSG